MAWVGAGGGLWARTAVGLLCCLWAIGCSEPDGETDGSSQQPDATADLEAQTDDSGVGAADASQDIAAHDIAAQDVPVDAAAPLCKLDADCAGHVDLGDSGPCAAARCVVGQCAKVATPSGTPCDDGDACTAWDACNGGSCGGSALSCDDSNPCTDDGCDKSAGCTAEPNSAPCDDDDACTQPGKCKGGACLMVLTNCDDGNACSDDACDPAKGCQHTGTDAACDDGNACTSGDACAKSGCVGVALVCDDGKDCTSDACKPAFGCVHLADSVSACDDGDACTAGDVCASGTCAGGGVDCADGDPCTKDSCAPDKGCLHPPFSGPCEDGGKCLVAPSCVNGFCQGKLDDCYDANSCTKDACDSKTGKCVHTPIQGCTLVASVPYQTDMPCAGLPPGWSVVECSALHGICGGEFKTEVTGSKWSLDNTPALPATQDCALNFNNGKDYTCDKVTGPIDAYNGVHGWVLSPLFDTTSLPAGAPLSLRMQLSGTWGQTDADTLFVEALLPGEATPVQLAKLSHASAEKWTDTVVALNKVAGSKFALRFRFWTLDCTHNGGTGAFIDDVRVYASLDCTADVQCVQYDDVDACNGTMKCLPVQVLDGPAKKQCQLDPATIVTCPASDDSCTVTTCQQATGKCVAKTQPAGVACTSGDACLVGGTCNAAGACAGKKKSCDDGEVCTMDSCAAKVGCQNVALQEGKTCDDGNPCSKEDVCKAGVCAGAQACACKADAECAQYEDGDLCNGLWQCVDGACKVAPGSAVLCPAVSATCKANICQPKTGACKVVPRPDGVSCDDADLCTAKTTCKAGICGGGDAIQCGDGGPCQKLICDAKLGCGGLPINGGKSCDDGNGCTDVDTCNGGNCVGVKANCDDGNACTLDVCYKGIGGCAGLIDDNQGCNDGDACTAGDHCVDGTCTAKALGCDDGDPCTKDSCDVKKGCANLLQVGGGCDDGVPCTIKDSCAGNGLCQGVELDCDDGDPCTIDSCAKGICLVLPAPVTICDDGDACTTKDACDGQGSCAGVKLDCDDGNPCTKSMGCDAKTGCKLLNNDKAKCSDNNVCTIFDHCSEGVCKSIPKSCSDKNLCTDDSCDIKLGCQHPPADCDDGNSCTLDTCYGPWPKDKDKVQGCAHELLGDGVACDDGDACTGAGKCKSTTCVSPPVSCDDGDPCTVDSCDSDDGCASLPEAATTTACDDGDPCTEDRCDGAGKCVGEKKICDDGDPCTADSCAPGKGCVAAKMAEGAACDDGHPCTTQTACHGGACGKGKVICKACPDGQDSECDVFVTNKCLGNFKCLKANESDKGGLCYLVPVPVQCDASGDQACIKNSCQAATGQCAMQPLSEGSPCEDGQPCTLLDSCKAGACVPGGPPDCSGVADLCNTGGCEPSPKAKDGWQCVSLPKAGTIACDADSDGCTVGDQCVNGACAAGAKFDCADKAGPCQQAFCVADGASGHTCKVILAPLNTPCEDGQTCTTGDFCLSGKCNAGKGAADCSELDSSCAKGVCDAGLKGGAGACTAQIINEGGLCNADDNGCTQQDICVKGACLAGAYPDCSGSSVPCQHGSCKNLGPDKFTCIATPFKDDQPCNLDGDGCTVDACKSGKCTLGPTKDCSAKDGPGPCVIGICLSANPLEGVCVAGHAKAGAPCNADDDGCTKDDGCDGKGSCSKGTKVDCLVQAGGCTSGSCTSTGSNGHKCDGKTKPDGAACDADGDGCTDKDSCKAGKCAAGGAVDCSGADKGECVVGKCTSKGADSYLCQASPRPAGTPCDADSDGCTKKDSCAEGSCAKGVEEDCGAFKDTCNYAECLSVDAGTFKCAIKPVPSWPVVDPAKECQVGDPAKGCEVGYTCTAEVVGQSAGSCVPDKTVSCDDGKPCTTGDTCTAGVCMPTVELDCDDGDPCTLDSCGSGQCQHALIGKCATCIDENFDVSVEEGKKPVLPKAWISDSKDMDFVTWQPDASAPYGGSKYAARAAWQGPHKQADKIAAVPARMLHRRVYLRAGGGHQLEFQLAMTVTDQGCDTDTIAVWVNNAPVWQRCGDSQPASKINPYEKISVDLSKLGGAHADIEFRVSAGTSDKAKGSVDVEQVKLTGNCSEGCLGVDFEERRAFWHDKMAVIPRLPQPWAVSSEAPATLSWQLSKAGGHTGKAAYGVSWSGPPPAGKEASATLSMKAITVGKGSTLHMAVRAPVVGIKGCDADALRLILDGKELFKLCDLQSNWQVIELDLAAWQGKIIDLDLVATTGAGGASKGAFEVDNIAIAGPCEYLCYRETFDDKGLKEWSIEASDAAVLTWKLVSNTFYSKPFAIWSGFTAQLAGGDGATVYGKETAGHRFLVPVAGARYRYAARLVYPDYCPKDPKDVHPSPMLVALRRSSLSVSNNGGVDEGDDGSFRVSKHCKGNDAWTVYTGEVVGLGIDKVKTGPRGLTMVPEVGLHVTEAGVKMDVWIDEMSYTCR